MKLHVEPREACWCQSRPRRTTIRRGFRFERWRVGAWLRVFRGHGLANFEFEFRLGLPRSSPALIKQMEEMSREASN